jgi:hypothetical protein
MDAEPGWLGVCMSSKQHILYDIWVLLKKAN